MPNFSDLLPVEDPIEDVDQPELDETDPELDEGEPAPDEGEGDEGQPEGDAGEGEPGEGGDDEPAPIGDGKSIPPELKELIKLHPDRAKMLRDMYFTNARYNKFGKVGDLQKLQDYVNSYGSLEDAQRIKEQLDSVGDLNELIESHKTYQALDEKFTAGDPAYVDHLAKVNPEAFSKIAPSFLSRFGADHPEQYNYLMSQVVVSTLINNGMANQLSLLGQAAASGNVEQVKQIAAQLSESVGALQSLSQRAPQVRQADPRVKELETERAKFQQERQQSFVNDIRERTNGWASPLITKALAPYGKLKPEMLARLDRDVKEEIGALLGQNAKFQQKIKQAISRGDRDGALRLYREAVTPLMQQAARKVAGEYGLKAAAKKAATNAGGAPSGTRGAQRGGEATAPGFERVTKYPDVKDVRRDFDEYYDWAAKDQFLLKDGRKIKVVS